MIAVSSQAPYNKKAEIFEDGAWTDIQDPPAPIGWGQYAVVFDAGNFYYFGGWNGHYISSILRLDATSWTWSEVGSMTRGRHGHGVFVNGNTFMQIGGNGHYRTEACVLSNGQFTCEENTTVQPLGGYAYWPFLLPVSDTFELC